MSPSPENGLTRCKRKRVSVEPGGGNGHDKHAAQNRQGGTDNDGGAYDIAPLIGLEGAVLVQRGKETEECHQENEEVHNVEALPEFVLFIGV